MTTARSPAWTLAGLTIALLGGPALLILQKVAFGVHASVPETLAREAMLFALAGVLVLIILRGERLPLSSVGLRTDRLGRTALLALGIFVTLGLGSGATLALLHVIGLPLPHFPGFKPPPLVLTLVVVRAGIVEELFYRGYAIERLTVLCRNKWMAATVPLLFFTAAHYRGGVPGMLVAFVLGGILTFFYMWKRSLLANIAGHFLIDFVPNVLLPVLAGS